MKRFWFIGLLIADGLVGNAQTYHPFPTDNATWSQIMYNWGQWGQECWWTKHYGLAGDTTINAQQYSKLYGINHSDWYIDVDQFILDSATYAGGIREDSSKKVYFLPADSADEFVLYDFGMEIGDTFYYAPSWNSSWNDSIPFVLSQIDSVELNDGTFRKRYYLAGGATWIEGIGNVLGWFELSFTGTFDPWLTCFSENGEYLYNMVTGPANGYCSCRPTWWNSIGTLSDRNIKLFPNPVDHKLTVQIPTSTDDAIIYNALGQLFFQSQVVQQNLMTIDVSSLPNGIYYLMLTGPESSYRQTFVKQ